MDDGKENTEAYTDNCHLSNMNVLEDRKDYKMENKTLKTSNDGKGLCPSVCEKPEDVAIEVEKNIEYKKNDFVNENNPLDTRPGTSKYCINVNVDPNQNRETGQLERQTNTNSHDDTEHSGEGVSLHSIESFVCRICHNCENPERLVSPCLCKGTLSYVHSHCLERWISMSRCTTCELCQFQYNTRQTLRYGILQSLRMWYSRSVSRRALQEDCQMFSLLTLVAFGIIGTLLVAVQYYIIQGHLSTLNRLWTKGWLMFFLITTMVVYFVNVYMIIKSQLTPWYRWWQSARDIHLVLENRRPVMQHLATPQKQQSRQRQLEQQRIMARNADILLQDTHRTIFEQPEVQPQLEIQVQTSSADNQNARQPSPSATQQNLNHSNITNNTINAVKMLFMSYKEHGNHTNAINDSKPETTDTQCCSSCPTTINTIAATSRTNIIENVTNTTTNNMDSIVTTAMTTPIFNTYINEVEVVHSDTDINIV